MLARIQTASIHGVEALPVTVEVDVRKGGAMPGLDLVGLPSTRVSEGKVRIRAALTNAGYKIPSCRVTINLAPAELRKDTAGFDLPIALAILAAYGHLPPESLDGILAVGELALDGSVRPVRGVLPTVASARAAGSRTALVPRDCGAEAAVVTDLDVRTVAHLSEAAGFLEGTADLPPAALQLREGTLPPEPDLAEVAGQGHAKRALEVAAAGGHNLLLVGPPGTGKSMLARRLPGILPPLTFDEALETTQVHSVAGTLNGTSLMRRRPFRAPHHTVSQAGLVGGGPHLRPGELSLAHNGVLFLDELLEFPRHILETLRQPLEDRTITITRARGSARLPANVQLVAAMNPCPCGHLGDPRRTCVCSDAAVERYRQRLSGPLLDRIDLRVEVGPVAPGALVAPAAEEQSAAVAERVRAARARQHARLGPGRTNAMLEGAALREACPLDPACEALLRQAEERLGLSARALMRVLRVARTVADLADRDAVTPEDLLEAIALRGPLPSGA